MYMYMYMYMCYGATQMYANQVNLSETAVHMFAHLASLPTFIVLYSDRVLMEIKPSFNTRSQDQEPTCTSNSVFKLYM